MRAASRPRPSLLAQSSLTLKSIVSRTAIPAQRLLLLCSGCRASRLRAPDGVWLYRVWSHCLKRWSGRARNRLFGELLVNFRQHLGREGERLFEAHEIARMELRRKGSALSRGVLRFHDSFDRSDAFNFDAHLVTFLEPSRWIQRESDAARCGKLRCSALQASLCWTTQSPLIRSCPRVGKASDFASSGAGRRIKFRIE